MTRSWDDHQQILSQFRHWLEQTNDEIEALEAHVEQAADESRPGVQAEPVHADREADPFDFDPAPNLEAASPQTIRGVDQSVPAASGESSVASQSRPPAVGLLQLVEAFTAMRHELKLHAKGARNLESTVTRSLEGLEAAARIFQSVEADEKKGAERAARPLVDALIGVDESLHRAVQIFQFMHGQMVRDMPAGLRKTLESAFRQQSWWRRWQARRWHERVVQMAASELARSANDEFVRVTEGLQMIQKRVASAMNEEGIRRIDACGVPVDPHRMHVVDLVADSTADPETVVEVLRPGYVWGERIVRYAEVRAVASRPAHPTGPFANHDAGASTDYQEFKSQGD